MLRLRNTLEKVLAVAGAVLMLTTLLLISLVGKNVTYVTRFTPPTTEKTLLDETYFHQTQILILALAAALVLLLPFLGYSTLAKSKRVFFPLWVAFLIIISILLLLNLQYLTGASAYRDYLSHLSSNINRSNSYCQ